MSIEKQITIHTNEPQEEYCPVCESTMTHDFYGNTQFLQCDNKECDHIIELGELNVRQSIRRVHSSTTNR